MRESISRKIYLSGPSGLKEKRVNPRPRTMKESISLLDRLNHWWRDWTDMRHVLQAVARNPIATAGEISDVLDSAGMAMTLERLRLLLDRLVIAGRVMKGWRCGGEVRYWVKGFRFDDWCEEEVR
ncbi:MAG: hypothetical protein HQM01_13090 [Magnetococcales bacterium]|nr:hypothetical protein [Magnetococcales bacterium]